MAVKTRESRDTKQRLFVEPVVLRKVMSLSERQRVISDVIH